MTKIHPDDQRTLDVIAELQGERFRQRNSEGWTAEHDDQHDNGALAAAAACYAIKASRPENDQRFGWCLSLRNRVVDTRRAGARPEL